MSLSDMAKGPSEKLRDRFYIARAEALNNYALVEKGLTFLFATCLDANARYASLIISKMINTRARNEVVQKITDWHTLKKFRPFTNSLFKLIGEVDGERNQLVHWHVKDREDGTFVLVPSDMLSTSDATMDENAIDALTEKCLTLAAMLSLFCGHVKHPTHPALHERFQQPLEYPLAPDDLLARWHTELLGQPMPYIR